MNKILLIIGREYLVRVRKRSFLVLTFLVPLLIAGMYGLIFYLAINRDNLGDKKKVQVMDPSGIFQKSLKDSKNLVFSYSEGNDLNALKSELKGKKFDFILNIPAIKDTALAAMGGQSISPTGIQLIGEKQASIQTESEIQDELERVLKYKGYLAAGIDTARLNRVKPRISIQNSVLTSEGEKSSDSLGAFIIGIASSITIYMFIFLYGVQVMRGVMEEKTSRIVEVIISSVKPFQLMMGKIVGIALVGLTQLLLWVVLSTVLAPIISSKITGKTKTESLQKASANAQNSSSSAEGTTIILKAITSQNYPFILSCFVFYFLTGYLLYSALFAAVGAAVDSETETQQFMFPISLPLVFSIILSSNYVINNPDSSLSVWLSMIPFFSPIVMMVRIPFHPPLWQVFLSMFFMILGFLGTVWVAGRIYRTGILLYGKKITFAELGKWLFYKS